MSACVQNCEAAKMIEVKERVEEHEQFMTVRDHSREALITVLCSRHRVKMSLKVRSTGASATSTCIPR